jgi:UDP:flavonoid glycosyltransferase YjiC (YdhE family)
MRLTIFAAGSRGDIQPCLVLGKALQRAGYQVRLAAPENFAGLVQAHGVEFYPLRGDVQQIMAGEAGRKFMQTGGANPIRSLRAMRSMLAPVVMAMAEDAYAACQEAEALICLGVFSAFGSCIASALRIPMINLEPTPLLPSRAFAAPSWPIQRDLGGLHNYLSGIAMLQVVWLWYQPFVKDFRRRLKLPDISARQAYRTFRSTPLLGAYSPRVIPPPADWPESAHVSGYLFLEEQEDWQPPPALQAFLEAGDPPVYVGFGSMAGGDPAALAGLAAQALERSGQRGVLMTGWGGLRLEAASKDVFLLDAAPHSWLFARMAAVVHHGGAGTTAEGLRAGLSTVVVPFVFDQPFWGARIQALGLGPHPVPLKRLTADRLAEAIHLAVSDPGMRQRAQSLGAAIRAEDGPGNAVRIIRQALEAAGKRGNQQDV